MRTTHLALHPLALHIVDLEFLMAALMIVSDMLDSLSNSLSPCCRFLSASIGLGGHEVLGDTFSTRKQTSFIPDGAATSPPLLTADITEFMLAAATRHGLIIDPNDSSPLALT